MLSPPEGPCSGMAGFTATRGPGDCLSTEGRCKSVCFSCRGGAGMSCFRKQPGCNIPSAVHSVSSARRGRITAAETTSPLPGETDCPCHTGAGVAGRRGELALHQRDLVPWRGCSEALILWSPWRSWGSQALPKPPSVPPRSPCSPTAVGGGGKRGLSCQLCNVKQVSKAPPYICRLKSNSLQYKKINYPGDSRLIPLIRPAPDGKQFFFLMC